MPYVNSIPGRLLLILLMLLPIAAASAAVYSWTDDDGKVQFGDRPPLDREVESITVRVNTYEPSSKLSGVDRPAAAKSKIILYTTQRCGYCRKAKQFLTRKNISFTEYDIETSNKGKRDFKKLNGTGVPVILVGDQRMNGFSEERLASMLKSAGYN